MTLAAIGCQKIPEFPGANVVLISIDTLRADHLSLYDYPRRTSPFLEELAGESVVFDQFIINGGFTLPSHMSMMTSLTPTVHGVAPHFNEVLPDERTTLAEVLQQAGYRTAGFVDKGWMLGKYGFRQGFDVYDDEGGHFEAILPKAYDWLDRNQDQRFFLFLHTYDVHSKWGGLPYGCPQPYPTLYTDEYEVDFDGCRNGKCASRLFKWINDETKAGRLVPTDVLTPTEVEYSAALYDGCINYVDAMLREVVDRLRSAGLLDRTLIVITSDHGEEFLDHGMLLHTQRAHEELAHVPLVVRFPGGAMGGRRASELTAMIDLMPTILQAVDLSPGPDAQGRSVLPALVRGWPARTDTTIWEALRTDRWKYLPETRELFDLESDPREKRNLWDERPEIVRRLAARSARHARDDRRLVRELGGTVQEEVPAELTEEELRQLKALGYLD